MLQTSTGSINQFLQNKSNRNTFSHTIKYTSSKDKKSFFNNSAINKSKEMISPKIELVKDNRLLTSYNERLSNKSKSKIFQSIDNTINRSTDSFPRIILTKRGIRQFSNSTFDTSNYLRDYQKTETNVIRRARSGYYVTQANEEKKDRYNSGNNSYRINSNRKIIQGSSSLPLFHDKLYDRYGTDKKEKGENARYSRRNIRNIKIDYNKSIKIENKNELNIKHILKNSSFNAESNNYSRKNRSIINYNTPINDSKKRLTLDNKNIYTHYISTSTNEKSDKSNKNKDNHIYFQKTDIKIKKEEMREEHKRFNLSNKNINSNLYEDSSQIKKVSVQTPKNNYKKIEESSLINKMRILNNKSNHILYESINLKKENQIGTQKPNQIKIKIINSYQNKSIKNIENFKEPKKITKIEKINKIDEIKDIRDKVMNTINKKSSNNLIKEPLDSDKPKAISDKKMNNNNFLVVKKNSSDNITSHNKQLKNFERRNLDINIDKNNNENIILKNYIKRAIKNNIPSSNNKESNHKINNEEKKEKKEKEISLPRNIRNNIPKFNSEENKINQKTKTKILDKMKAKDNKINNKKIILEICKASEVTFKGNKINKEIQQNNTNNSNIIIIINNPEQKKIKTLVQSPINNIDTNNNLNNSPIIKNDKSGDKKENENNNVDKNNNINQNKDAKNKLINKRKIKTTTKIKRKPLKNINIIKTENKNIIINNLNENKINEEIPQNIINGNKNDSITNILKITKKENLNSIINKNTNIRYKDYEQMEKEKNINIKDNKIESDKKEKIKEESDKLTLNDINNEIILQKENNINQKDNIIENINDFIKENSNNNIKDSNSIPEIQKYESQAQQQPQPQKKDSEEKTGEKLTNNQKKEQEEKEEKIIDSQRDEEDEDDFPKDSIEKPNNSDLEEPPQSKKDSSSQLKDGEIPKDQDEHLPNPSSLSKNEINAFANFNNSLTKKEPENSLSNHLSQEKKPDLNNADMVTEEIQEIKPVIQHNIERKRPVFTLPPDKKRSISQGRPFHLINKYYDESFILEDDEEERFKNYIYNNDDSRSDAKSNNTLNSRDKIDIRSNSNKKFDNISEENKNEEKKEKDNKEEKDEIDNINNEINNDDNDKIEEKNENIQ